MQWVLKLEARSGWGEVETIEVGRFERRVLGLTAEELGLTLGESKTLLGELARLVLQTQVEEFITSDRICGSCLGLRRLRDRRTRRIQTLFGNETAAHKIRISLAKPHTKNGSTVAERESCWTRPAGMRHIERTGCR